MGCRLRAAAVVAFALCAPLLAAASGLCYAGCHFRFCSWRGTFAFGKHNDVALTGGICDKRGARVGYVYGIGEAFLVQRDAKRLSFSPISRWRPKGLHPPLPKTLFKSYHVYRPKWRPVWKPVYKWKYTKGKSKRKNDDDDEDDDERPRKKEKVWVKRWIKGWVPSGKSGVGHQAFNGNQLSYVNRKCFVLPITMYQKLRKDGKHTSNVKTREGRDCVAFFVNSW